MMENNHYFQELCQVKLAKLSLSLCPLRNTTTNTHPPAALYRTFPPQEALRILSKLAFHYTPKHGSWLNMVELELSVLSRQCLERRIPSITQPITQLRQETEAWEEQRNQNRATVNWCFFTVDARTRFERFYPTPSLS